MTLEKYLRKAHAEGGLFPGVSFMANDDEIELSGEKDGRKFYYHVRGNEVSEHPPVRENEKPQ